MRAHVLPVGLRLMHERFTCACCATIDGTLVMAPGTEPRFDEPMGCMHVLVQEFR